MKKSFNLILLVVCSFVYSQEELKDKLEEHNVDECGICPEGECDCEPEVCI